MKKWIYLTLDEASVESLDIGKEGDSWCVTIFESLTGVEGCMPSIFFQSEAIDVLFHVLQL
jgi:hypothetical protein